MTTRDWVAGTVQAGLDHASTKVFQITLERGDTAWNPCSASTPVAGPAVVTYTQYPDGGIQTRVQRGLG